MSRIQYILSIIILLTFSGMDGRAQQTQIVKANALSPLFRTANVSFEHTLNESRSLQLGFYYSGVTIRDVRFRGVGITPEYRFYLSQSREAPNGFYVAPFLRYQNLRLELTEQNGGGRLTALGGGVIAGYQFALGQRSSLDLFAGPSYSATSLRANGVPIPTFPIRLLTGFLPRAGVTLGIAF